MLFLRNINIQIFFIFVSEQKSKSNKSGDITMKSLEKIFITFKWQYLQNNLN